MTNSLKAFLETLGEHKAPLMKTLREAKDNGRACYDLMYKLGIGTKYDLVREYMGYAQEEVLLMGEDFKTKQVNSMSDQGPLREYQITLYSTKSGSKKAVGGFLLKESPANIGAFVEAYGAKHKVLVEYAHIDSPYSDPVYAARGNWSTYHHQTPLGCKSGSPMELRDFLTRYDMHLREALESSGVNSDSLVVVRGDHGEVAEIDYSTNPPVVLWLNHDVLRGVPRYWAYIDGPHIYTAEFEPQDEHLVEDAVKPIMGFSPKAFHSRQAMLAEIRKWRKISS